MPKNIMPQYIDSYYLVDSRQAKVVYDFLMKFSEKIKEVADDYLVTHCSDVPERIFYSVEELLLFLENNPTYDYSVYWENEEEESEIKQFNVHYTNDGKMIFGVSTVGNDTRSINSVSLFDKVTSYLRSKNACITIEEPPPSNSIEFIEFCKMRFIPQQGNVQ